MKERKYPRWARPLLRDKCDHCHGQKGGYRGNENIVFVEGVRRILCDHCTYALKLV